MTEDQLPMSRCLDFYCPKRDECRRFTRDPKISGAWYYIATPRKSLQSADCPVFLPKMAKEVPA